MSGQFFVDESERRVYETVVRSEAGDVYLSRGREFFWAIEEIKVLYNVRSIALAAAGAEVWCFSGSDVVFKASLVELSNKPASVYLVIPPCQPAGFVLRDRSDLSSEATVVFKWRPAAESEWEPPEMPDPPEMPEIEGA